MRVLVTGAGGFVGQNLVEALKNIRDGKDRRERFAPLLPLEVFEYDLASTPEQLDEWCGQTDFVFNLAGVNRPKDPADFMAGNRDFASDLLVALERNSNICPVLLSSSTQATLTGRFAGSEYGKSKLASEHLFEDYAQRTGAKVLVYRFPNLYGKWCRPNYNSAVATFCHNITHDLPVTIDDPSTKLELLYIDDLIDEMLNALLGQEHRGDDGFCSAGPTDTVTLGQIVDLLHSFKEARASLAIPDVSDGGFSKKLYSTYLSYLSTDDFSYEPMMHSDPRGSFTELMRTPDRGQVSVNVTKPGITKGQHWHNTKWEKFCVVSGEGLIRLRRVGTDRDGAPFTPVEYQVSGDRMEVVEMIPGYTHSITNLSTSQDLVTLMWCNECFDPSHPDTFNEEV